MPPCADVPDWNVSVAIAGGACLDVPSHVVVIAQAGAGGGINHNVLSTSHPDSDETDTPADGDVLTYDLAAGKWVASPGGGGAGSGALLRKTSDQTITTATTDDITFQSTIFDDDSYVVGSSPFTELAIPSDGLYVVYASLLVDSGPSLSAQDIQLRLRVNGTGFGFLVQARHFDNTFLQKNMLQASLPRRLSAGDLLNLEIVNGSAVSVVVRSSATVDISFFGITRLGS